MNEQIPTKPNRRYGCCQSNRNSSAIGRALTLSGGVQAARLCHSAKAAERRVLKV